jgi:predicted negative regulator of RcsB-dependent stress response
VVSCPPTPSFLSREKRSTILCLLLVLLILAFYNPVVHNGFTNMDDDAYITGNVHVQAGLTWTTVKWAFTSFDAANWHPATWLSHALDCQLFNLNPVGHHYVNVLMHGVNAILLFLLLESATGLTWPSLMVAALFALHPVNVESVAWASERKNVLSMLFFLLTLNAYGWYVRKGGVYRYAVVAGLFAVGLMAKSEIITLPFVLLLWDYWPLDRLAGAAVLGSVLSSPLSVLKKRHTEELPGAAAPVSRSFSFLFLEKVPLLALSAGSAVMTLLAQSAGGAVHTTSTPGRFGNAIVAYVRYLGEAFWPVRLAAYYPHPRLLLPTWEIVASATVLLVLTAFVLHWRSHRYLMVGWLWFLGTLVPVIGLVQVGAAAMADRYAYLPFIGLFICVVWGSAELARERRMQAAWLGLPAVLVLLTLGTLSYRQIAYWRDSVTLWKHALDLTERNYIAHWALGSALAEKDQSEDAIAEFDAAESLHNYAALDRVAIAAYKRNHGHVQAAIEEYGRALEVSPDSKTRAIVLSRLASAYIQTGDFDHAKASCASGLEENPNNSSALVDSGLLAERNGDFELATEQFSHAMKVAPTDVGYLLLGYSLRRAGRLPDAQEAYADAQRMSRDFVQAQQSAAQLLAAAGVKGE